MWPEWSTELLQLLPGEGSGAPPVPHTPKESLLQFPPMLVWGPLSGAGVEKADLVTPVTMAPGSMLHCTCSPPTGLPPAHH